MYNWEISTVRYVVQGKHTPFNSGLLDEEWGVIEEDRVGQIIVRTRLSGKYSSEEEAKGGLVTGKRDEMTEGF